MEKERASNDLIETRMWIKWAIIMALTFLSLESITLAAFLAHSLLLFDSCYLMFLLIKFTIEADEKRE